MDGPGKSGGWARDTVLVIVAFAAGMVAGHRLFAPSGPSFAEVAERLGRSVGLVWYHDDSGWASYGTCFAVDDAGHLLTCAHVVHGRKEVTVAVPTVSGEKNLTARVIAEDLDLDAAILMIEEPGLTPVRFGSSGGVHVGEEVAISGFPLGYTVNADLTPSLTAGHIAAIPEWRVRPGSMRIRMLQVDASIAAGQSGSPLFLRSTGEVVGMMKSQIHVPGLVGSAEDIRDVTEAIPEELAAQNGIGLALPADGLRAFLAENGVAQ